MIFQTPAIRRKDGENLLLLDLRIQEQDEFSRRQAFPLLLGQNGTSAYTSFAGTRPLRAGRGERRSARVHRFRGTTRDETQRAPCAGNSA